MKLFWLSEESLAATSVRNVDFFSGKENPAVAQPRLSSAGELVAFSACKHLVLVVVVVGEAEDFDV